MVVCGAQPQKTMPLIASQISDRDNAVRSAALNAMVVVYGNVGESMYKFSSQVCVCLCVCVCAYRIVLNVTNTEMFYCTFAISHTHVYITQTYCS